MYVKLFGSILKSSVWDESPATRLVWITLLLLADEDGFAQGVERGLARQANVSPEECFAALEVLAAPDLASQTQDYGGRRIEKVEGGWLVLNYKKYREIKTREQLQAAARQRRKYHADKQLGGSVGEESREAREVSRSSASLSVSASSASDADVVARFRSAHPKPDAFDKAMGRLLARYPIPVLHQAMVEMEGAGARFSEHTVSKFADKVTVPRQAPSYQPAQPIAAKWCAECGDGELRPVEGQKRHQRFHSEECSHA